MKDLWDNIQTGWGTFTGAVESIANTVTESGIYKAGQSVAGFLQTQANTPLGKFATASYGDFMKNRKKLRGQTVRGKRVSSSRFQGGGSQASFKAGQSNLAITPTVKTAYQSALKARADSPIAATLAQLAAKKKSVSIMKITDVPPIKVRRSR